MWRHLQSSYKDGRQGAVARHWGAAQTAMQCSSVQRKGDRSGCSQNCQSFTTRNCSAAIIAMQQNWIHSLHSTGSYRAAPGIFHCRPWKAMNKNPRR